jgi:hypothetical protein
LGDDSFHRAGLRCTRFHRSSNNSEEIPMVEPPKYRLPVWIQALWVIVGAPLLVLKFFLSMDVWGTIAVAALAALSFVTIGYNKIKTGMWLPGAKKNE